MLSYKTCAKNEKQKDIYNLTLFTSRYRGKKKKYVYAS